MRAEMALIQADCAAARRLAQNNLSAWYGFGGVVHNPVPWVSCPVLPADSSESDRNDAEMEQALKAFGINFDRQIAEGHPLRVV